MYIISFLPTKYSFWSPVWDLIFTTPMHMSSACNDLIFGNFSSLKPPQIKPLWYLMNPTSTTHVSHSLSPFHTSHALDFPRNSDEFSSQLLTFILAKKKKKLLTFIHLNRWIMLGGLRLIQAIPTTPPLGIELYKPKYENSSNLYVRSLLSFFWYNKIFTFFPLNDYIYIFFNK